jgi:hypothetical protein
VGVTRNEYTILIGKPEGKRPLGICSWESDIKTDLREIVCEGWITLSMAHLIGIVTAIAILSKSVILC